MTDTRKEHSPMDSNNPHSRPEPAALRHRHAQAGAVVPGSDATDDLASSQGSAPSARDDMTTSLKKDSRRAALLAAIEHLDKLALEQAVDDLGRAVAAGQQALRAFEQRRRELVALCAYLGSEP